MGGCAAEAVDDAGVPGAGAQEAECHLGVLKFADSFKKGASFVNTGIGVGSNKVFGWFLTETQQSLALKKFKHLGNVQYEAYTFR